MCIIVFVQGAVLLYRHTFPTILAQPRRMRHVRSRGCGALWAIPGRGKQLCFKNTYDYGIVERGMLL